MAETSQDKVQKIAEAGFEAFLLHGFKRCSMEDIAQRAGMSRAAVYLHFKNKGDIFATVMTRYHDADRQRFEAALNPGRPVSEAIPAALAAKDAGLSARLNASPHGGELRARAELSQDHFAAALAQYFLAVLAKRGAAAETPPDQLARFVMTVHAALDGSEDGAEQYGLLGKSAAALLGTD